MHQSFVTKAPHIYGYGRGIAGLIWGQVTFWVPRSVALLAICDQLTMERRSW